MDCVLAKIMLLAMIMDEVMEEVVEEVVAEAVVVEEVVEEEVVGVDIASDTKCTSNTSLIEELMG